MLWIDFLEKVATDPQYQCRFTKTPRERFLKIFADEKPETYSAKQSKLAHGLGYDPDIFGRYLTEIYKALDPFFKEKNFQLRTKEGKGRDAYQETRLCRVYGLLKTCYLKELENLERQSQATIELIGIEEKLHQQLQEFNYFDEEAVFKSQVNQGCCNAFLVRVNEEASQKWLARRLAEKIPNFSYAKRIPFDLRNARINDDLFIEIAQSVLGNALPRDENEIIEEIAQICRRQTLIVALYGVGELEKQDWERLNQNFWGKLIEDLNQEDMAGRCTLLLFEDVDFECPIELPNFHQLEPWEKVKSSYWRSWTNRQDVQSLWQSCQETNSGRAFSGTPPDKPQRALEKICREFQPQEHKILLDEMKRKVWDLAA
jgi:hypothetical protein